MRKTLLLLALMGGCFMANADNVMVITTTAAAQQYDFAIDDITKITFGDDGFSVITAHGEFTQLYDETQSIKFELGTSGVKSIIDEVGGIAVTYANQQLRIERHGAAGPYDIALYDIGGTVLLADKSYEGSSIDVSALPNGIYIARINKTTIKFIKK